MSARPPFKGLTCRGSYALGTACGHCERCEWERNRRTEPDISPDARIEQARALLPEGLAAIVCHDEQMTVWADEVKMEMLGHLREPADYEEVLSLDAAVKAAIRHVVERAFGHPALLHIDTCGWCGERAAVTEPRDYGYPPAPKGQKPCD